MHYAVFTKSFLLPHCSDMKLFHTVFTKRFCCLIVRKWNYSIWKLLYCCSAALLIKINILLRKSWTVNKKKYRPNSHFLEKKRRMCTIIWSMSYISWQPNILEYGDVSTTKFFSCHATRVRVLVFFLLDKIR